MDSAVSMFVKASKATIAKLSTKLPWGAKRAIADALADDFGPYSSFHELGRKLGVEAISVVGKNGTFWGSLEDKWLLGRYAQTGAWSSETIELYKHFLAAHGGGTFVDIGANIGLTLVPVAQDPSVDCIGFEPEPRNVSFLRMNIERNCEHDNVRIEAVALFDHDTEMQFELSPINSGDHRLRVSDADGSYGEASRSTMRVSVRRLDDMMPASWKRPLVAKIDTQGSEPGVFAGGSRTLAQAELISLEFTPYSIRRMGGEAAHLLEFIGDKFAEGSVTPGDQPADLQWKPVDDVIAELRKHWDDPHIGTKYFEVLVRK